MSARQCFIAAGVTFVSAVWLIGAVVDGGGELILGVGAGFISLVAGYWVGTGLDRR